MPDKKHIRAALDNLFWISLAVAFSCFLGLVYISSNPTLACLLGALLAIVSSAYGFILAHDEDDFDHS